MTEDEKRAIEADHGRSSPVREKLEAVSLVDPSAIDQTMALKDGMSQFEQRRELVENVASVVDRQFPPQESFVRTGPSKSEELTASISVRHGEQIKAPPEHIAKVSFLDAVLVGTAAVGAIAFEKAKELFQDKMQDQQFKEATQQKGPDKAKEIDPFAKFSLREHSEKQMKEVSHQQEQQRKNDQEQKQTR